MSYPPATKRAALLRATRTAETSRSTVVVAPAALPRSADVTPVLWAGGPNMQAA